MTWCAPSSWDAVFKLLLTLIALAVSSAAFSGGGTAVTKTISVFKAGNYTKTVTSIAALTARDLRHASKAENVAGLLDLAQKENRIDAIQAIQLSGSFSGLRKGDELLLICLKNGKCQPDSFYASAKNSDLHAEVLRRVPELGPTNVSHTVGAISESLMLRFFESYGWKVIDGQVGRAGFDGLLIKVDGAGSVRELLIVESKFNTSALKTTNHGTQMSDEWVRKKIQNLRNQFPDNDTYRQIESLIDEGSYRARLWNMKVENGRASIEVKSVHSKDGALTLQAVDDAERPPLVIDFRAPKNDFDKRFATWYSEELDNIGQFTADR